MSAKSYVYWWADGIYFNVRLDEERSCVLVLMGALEDGTKELLAVVDGYRESTQSWRELLGQLKRHGLTVAPKLAIGDGSLGFWLALREEYCPVPQQRCWVHKTANILDKMPRSVQGRAKELIHEMYLSPTRQAASAAHDQFIAGYQAKYPKATELTEITGKPFDRARSKPSVSSVYLLFKSVFASLREALVFESRTARRNSQSL